MISRNNLIKIFNRNLISAFTLLEILIVIGILSTLATVVVYVLNPAELLKQSRDAKRLSEIQTLDDAVRFYTFNSGTLDYGTSSVVYLSLPDSKYHLFLIFQPSHINGRLDLCLQTRINLQKSRWHWLDTRQLPLYPSRFFFIHPPRRPH